MRSAEARLARKTLTGELLTCVWRATEARISALPTTPSTKVSEYTAREGPLTQNRLAMQLALLQGNPSIRVLGSVSVHLGTCPACWPLLILVTPLIDCNSET